MARISEKPLTSAIDFRNSATFTEIDIDFSWKQALLKRNIKTVQAVQEKYATLKESEGVTTLDQNCRSLDTQHAITCI